MKKNKVDRHNGKRATAIFVSLLILAAIAFGAITAYRRLRGLWLEQCVITDLSRQVTVSTGNIVRSDAVIEALSLRNGVNLALVDFQRQREEVMRRYPIIRSLSISRHLPDRVEISVIEREPMVRIELAGRGKATTGHVVDSEGVVFICRRRTSLLPVIFEKPNTETGVGQRLKGRSLAALQLIAATREPEFSNLNIAAIDTTKLDYLEVTLGSASIVKFAWEGMDRETGDRGHRAMIRQLRCLTQAINAKLTRPGVSWNATVPNRIYAQ